MAHLYSLIEPYDGGMLDVGDGNHVYWETCGKPDGKPAVVLHGGPGSGCTPRWRRFFDPNAYRTVFFDQRGCGRSTPDAADPKTDLASNTTHHMIADLELLRRQLGIERWLVFGGSWGSTLGLAYAERHCEHVTELILFSVATTTRREVEWITRDIGRMFPAQWRRMLAGVPDHLRAGNLADAYGRLLNDADAVVREQAAKDWCAWEDAHVALGPNHRPDPRFDDPIFRMRFARLVTHYWRHAAWIEDGHLLQNVGKLASIPGVLIHGRLDLSSPPDVAWELAQAWPRSQLILIDEAGHGAGNQRMVESIVAATDRFR